MEFTQLLEKLDYAHGFMQSRAVTIIDKKYFM